MNSFSKVLVTGGAGFIGSHLVDKLLEQDVHVLVLDDLSGGDVRNIQHHSGKTRFRFVQGDIRDHNLVEKLLKDVEVVFHHAALIGIQRSIEDPILVNDVNVAGTLHLLKSAAELEVRRFIFASSAAVYGNASTMPIKEEHPLQPLSPYGVSKLAAEKYVKTFYDVFNLETVCLRYFNVYGLRQVYNQYSGVISQFLNNLKSNCPPAIFGDGYQTRDFVHVRDVVNANLLASEKEGVAGSIFNVGTGEPTTINQLAKIALKIAHKKSSPIYSEPKKEEIKHSCADVSKAKRILNYSPEISLYEGFKQLFENACK